jgi:CDP-diacylglycerol--glycerol-3-phosphate 3-phosphatidyltransferase
MLNWANIVTFGRVLLAPVFLVFLVRNSTLDHAIALGVFAAAVSTDLLDGYLARRLRCVSDFGKLADPLADKLIVLTGLISFVATGDAPLWMVLVIVGRELLMTGFRLLAAIKGIYIYASLLAKWKTTFQMGAVTLILGHKVIGDLLGSVWPALFDVWLGRLADFTLWVALILTVVTGLLYLWKNRGIIRNSLLR